MERLGRNVGGYGGERIDIEVVAREIETAARSHGWSVDALAVEGAPPLLALRRVRSDASRSVYLSAGVHGDEPAGPLAVRQLLQEDVWPENASVWVCPCLNPSGFAQNRRANAQGLDLNRDYRHLASPEVRAHVAWLRSQPRFDLTICLHEDWEAHGFYVYELHAPTEPACAPRVIRAVETVAPVDRSPEIDGRPARDGMIFPSLDLEARAQWPEALYLFRHHTTCALTLEAPSDFPLSLRVAALVAGTRAALAGD